MKTIGRKAKNTPHHVRVSTIVNEELKDLPRAIKGVLPQMNSIKRFASRKQNKPKLPKNPETLKDIEIPEAYQYIESKNGLGEATKEKFLYYQSPANVEDRFFIFTTEECITFLLNSPTLYADGTFKVPKVFKQILTIHGECGPTFATPLIYVFLPGKTQELYQKVIRTIKDMIPGLHSETSVVKRFMTDFEKGLQNAVKLEFGNQITVVGCFFHFQVSFFFF